MKKVFLQIGATRDGQNPYCHVAQSEGYYTVLAEMGDYVDYQSVCLNLPFDMILKINSPESPFEVLQAYINAGLNERPQVVLAGFEAYNQSVGRIKEMLTEPHDHHCFIPLDKYAQRTALSKVNEGISQPEFLFFESLLSIINARDKLPYPCVVKPIDGGGGLGIWLVKTADDLDTAIDKLATTNNYGGRRFSGFIVESWLHGVEFSLQGIVSEGIPYALTCCQKLIEHSESPDGTISFYESGHVGIAACQLPSTFTHLMSVCCETFDYRKGSFHIDFILVDGVPYFLEMGFRLSGMGVVDLVKEVTGLSWARIAFNIEQGKPFTGLELDTTPKAVGQLRLRQSNQLMAAELWVKKNKRGNVHAPMKLPQLSVASDSTLYSDLTRHAGILGTLKLVSNCQHDIMSVFNSILNTAPLPLRKSLLCAG